MPATVVHISEDAGGLWLSTGAGLYRLDPASGDITRYQHDPDDPTGLSSNDVKSSGEDRQGNFWVGTSEGLDRFDRQTRKVTMHVPLGDPVRIGFFEDHQGNFWIYHASGDGLAALDRVTGRLTRYSFRDRPSDPSELTGVMGMTEDEHGGLWVGSPDGGLFRFDRERRRFESFKNDPADLRSLAEDKVIALFTDREGNIWTGLHSSAPNSFSPRPPLFETFRHEPGNPDSLEMNFVNAMFEDSRGYLWIGNDRALTRIDRTNGEHVRFREGLGDKPMVITIAEDRKGAIWVGTYGQGMARLDQETRKFTTYLHRPDDPTSLGNDQVHRLYIDQAGTLWAATDDGLSRFDSATETFETYKVNPANRWAQAYVALAEDGQGTFWLGTHYSGLHRFDPKTGEFVVYKAEPGVSGSLGDNMVPTVHIDASGTIWVGTQSGLNRFDPRTERFAAYYQSERRPGDTVSCILEDKAGNLWISSNKGLFKFDPGSGVFQNYTSADGLPGDDLTGWGTGFQSKSGEMFFGGFAGGVAFRPESLADTSYVPPVVLTNLKLPFASSSQARAATDGRAIGFAEQLVLPHGANSLALEFSALSYFNPSTNRYRYRLEGLEDRWIEVDSAHRTATYTTLPVGNYIFRLQGAASRGAWSEPGIALPIRILPAWWETWWLRSVAALAVLGIAVWGYHLRVGQIRDRGREFRKLAENAPDMVMRFDTELRLCYANPAAEQFAGSEAGGLVRKNPVVLESEGKLLPVRLSALQAVIGNGKSLTEEFEISHPQGQFFFETRLIPEFGPDRTVLVMTRNITNRVQTEEALRKSQSALAHMARVTTIGELTASIAHEVNQPLTGIVTNGNACLRWLGAAPPNLEEAHQSVNRIIRDGKRAAEIIARIRALVRRTETQMSAMDLNEAVREVAQIVEPEARRNGVEMDLNLVSDLPRIQGDRVQLQQVMLNLMINAIEAMIGEKREHRELHVASEKDDAQVMVIVRDTGHGFDPGARDRIFEAFFTTKPHGMGMGLAISRSIVETHGGRLWATANETRGAAFRFTIPAAWPS